MTIRIRGELDPFVAVPNPVLHDGRLRPISRLVYAGLKFHLNRNSGQCNPSHATVAGELGVSPRSVRNAIDELVEHGLLRVEGDRKGGKRPNQYVLLTPWHDVPPSDVRVANGSGGVASGAYPGSARRATELEEEEQEGSSDAELASSAPHHYCLTRKRFVDHPRIACLDCTPSLNQEETS